jgi:hypothetical protein
VLFVLKLVSSGLYAGAKALRQASLFQEAMDSTFDTLLHAGEELPRSVGDAKLSSDMQVTNDVLQKTADDDYVLNMQQTNNKKIITLQKLYSNLADLLHFTKPSLICAVSLRMVELTLSEGLTPNSPLAFAYYGQMLMGSGNLAESCRLGVSSCITTVDIFAVLCSFLCSLFNTLFPCSSSLPKS